MAETLEKRIKDPRLGFITVTDVRVTPDIREASVFYTVYGDEESRAATAAALESAKGVLRSEVGKQTGVKFTPTLEFFPDAIPETAAHLEELLQAGGRGRRGRARAGGVAPRTPASRTRTGTRTTRGRRRRRDEDATA